MVKPIAAKDANRIIKALHYSGKVVQNSQVHFGVFLDGRCGGGFLFGPSLKKKGTVRLVGGTGWNGFLELNRMALADWMPANGESRSISVAMRLLKRSYPHLKWVVSFADAAQCGDGAIYRASGFVLTAIRQKFSLRTDPETGEQMHAIQAHHKKITTEWMRTWVQLPGFQLRYIYFLDPTARERLTVPIIPFSEIERRGAGMYRGKPRVRSVDSDTSANHAEMGGAIPTRTLT